MKKLQIFKRSLMMLMAIMFLMTGYTTYYAENTPSAASGHSIQTSNAPAGFDKVASKSGIELYIDRSSTIIAVKNTVDGHIWYSSPLDRENDGNADGATIMEMSSLLVVQYVDKLNQKYVVNSMVGSVRRESYKVDLIENGVRVLLDFSREKEKFVIPVVIMLADGYLEVSVDTKGIKEYGDTKITTIAVMPYFGAGIAGDEGYMLVPDGSGALVSFKPGYGWAGEYNGAIYGRDDALTYIKDVGRREKIRMPVFGMRNQGSAFLSVIHRGSMAAAVTCRPAEYVSSYGNIFATFTYRQLDVTVIADRSWKSREISVLAPAPFSEPPCIRYYFLSGKDADYSGMANCMRNYLMKEYGLSRIKSSDSLPLYLDVYGAVKKRTSFLGMTVETVMPATTFDQAADMLLNLKQRGAANIAMLLEGFNKGGMYDTVQLDLSYDRKVGGLKGYRKLLKAADSAGTQIYPGVELLNLYRPKFGWWDFNTSAKAVNKDYAKQYSYRPSTGLSDPAVPSWILLKYSKVTEAAHKFINSYKKNPADGIYSGSLGDILYSDFDKASYTDRSKAAGMINKVMADMKKQSGQVIVKGGNAYALPYVDAVINTPMEDSQYSLALASIPFYQMVLHGLVSLAGTPLNSSINPQFDFLKHIETGTSLNFRWTGVDSSELRETRLNEVYDSYYMNWVDEASRLSKELNEVCGNLGDRFITKHEMISKDLRVTTYDNDVRVIVNFGSQSCEYEGQTIPAYGGSILR